MQDAGLEFDNPNISNVVAPEEMSYSSNKSLVDFVKSR